MMTELNLFAKECKSVLLFILENIFEPDFWKEFAKSIDTIKEDDLPLVRDLKAFINMLTALEKITNKVEKNFKPRISIFKEPTALRLIKNADLTSDLQFFLTNYQVYMSTNSILTHYLIYAKEFTWAIIFPLLKEKIIKLKTVCTEENMQKAVNYIIENLVLLEQYKENYEKRKISPPRPFEKDKDDFVNVFLRKADSYLRKMYKDFEENFPLDTKGDAKSENLENALYYYKINANDSDTVKNIKLLLNGIIAIKKVHNERQEYSQVGFLGGYGWITTMIQHIKSAYYSLAEFDYEAIWAEKSSPFMKIIKEELKKLNPLLEQLSCIIGQFEIEFHLKEGILLNIVGNLIERYNQITYQLKIPIDYVIQKDIFFLARFQFNENYLIEMDKQIEMIREFLIYRNYALSSIPPNIIVTLQTYISKYEDELCMDRELLDVYKICLEETLNKKRSTDTVFMSLLESAGTYFGHTIHHDVMQTLHHRMKYLTKQQRYLEEYLEGTMQYYQEKPYLYVTVPQDEGSQKEVIVQLLKTHIADLTTERDALQSTRDREIALKIKTGRFTINPEDVKPAMKNLITLKSKAASFFKSTLEQYEKTNKIEPLDKENNLPPQSSLLMAEIAHVLQV